MMFYVKMEILTPNSNETLHAYPYLLYSDRKGIRNA